LFLLDVWKRGTEETNSDHKTRKVGNCLKVRGKKNPRLDHISPNKNRRKKLKREWVSRGGELSKEKGCDKKELLGEPDDRKGVKEVPADGVATS